MSVRIFAARFSPARRRMVNVSIWPCSSCSPPSFTLTAAIRDHLGQRAFAFAAGSNR